MVLFQVERTAGTYSNKNGGVWTRYFYDARGYTERFHFDATNRLASQWDGRLGTAGAADSRLRTDHVYDSFDRLIAQHRTDTASQAVQTQGFEWSQFDQRTSFTDALNYRVLSRYDVNGNQLSETDAQGNTERFTYNLDNRLLQRTDRMQSATTTVYDAYGQRQSASSLATPRAALSSIFEY